MICLKPGDRIVGGEERSNRRTLGPSIPCRRSPCRFVAQARTPEERRKSTRKGSGNVAAD